MGKASRARSARQAVAEMKKEQEQKALALKKKKTTINIIVGAVSLLLAAVFIGTVIFLSAAKSNGSLLRAKTAIKSDNLKIDGTTFAYFLNYQYSDFVTNNSNNLSSYGLDISVSIRDQEYYDGQTWFDYMAEQTESNLTEVLYLAEKAKSEGMKLGDKEKKDIDDFIADLKKGAEESEFSFDEYLYGRFGQGVREEDIRKGLEISMLATKYYDETIDSVTYSDKEIQEYFEANSVDFMTVDYKYYKFTPATTEDMTEEEIEKEHKKATDNANRLAAATSPESFDSILTEILKENGTTEANIKTAIQNTVLTGSSYDEEFDISVWAFSADTKLNSTKLYPNGNSSSVYMITKLPYRNEGETRTVRHILISSDSYEKDEDAKAKADEVLAEFNKGAKTAESFGELAKKYSEDPGSATYGGIYEDFAKGTMVEPFEKWAFDSARKEGDTGIVKTDYGYHIMYFVKEGNPVWKNEVVLSLKDNNYEALYNKLKKTYTVTFNEAILDDIPVIKFSSSSATTY